MNHCVCCCSIVQAHIMLNSVNNVLILMTFSNIVQAVHREEEGGGQLNPLLYYTLSYISKSKYFITAIYI